MCDYEKIPDLEDKLGPIIEKEMVCPGGYLLSAKYDNELLPRDYYAVMEKSIIPQEARSYGKKIPGLWLFPMTGDSEEYKIIQYEIAKYRTQNNLPVDEPLRATAFLRRSLSRSILARFRFRSTRRGAARFVIGFWTMEFIGLKQISARKSWRSVIRCGQPSCPALRQAWGSRQSTTRPMTLRKPWVTYFFPQRSVVFRSESCCVCGLHGREP